MEGRRKLQPAALGFRVKSGWAMAAVLVGTTASPTLLRCAPALLSDAHFPGTKQPYHAALELSEKEAKVILQKLRKLVAAATKRSVTSLLKEANNAGYVVRGAALVVGSLVDPASLHNEHIARTRWKGNCFEPRWKMCFARLEFRATYCWKKAHTRAPHKSCARRKQQQNEPSRCWANRVTALGVPRKSLRLSQLGACCQGEVLPRAEAGGRHGPQKKNRRI